MEMNSSSCDFTFEVRFLLGAPAVIQYVIKAIFNLVAYSDKVPGHTRSHQSSIPSKPTSP